MTATKQHYRISTPADGPWSLGAIVSEALHERLVNVQGQKWIVEEAIHIYRHGNKYIATTENLGNDGWLHVIPMNKNLNPNGRYTSKWNGKGAEEGDYVGEELAATNRNWTLDAIAEAYVKRHFN